jgi:hypothetical protein
MSVSSTRGQSQSDAATGIAIEAGVLQVCPIHNDGIFTGPNDIEDAYKLGSARLKAGDADLKRLFSNQRELTDCIQGAVAMWDGDGCGPCNSTGNS